MNAFTSYFKPNPEKDGGNNSSTAGASGRSRGLSVSSSGKRSSIRSSAGEKIGSGSTGRPQLCLNNAMGLPPGMPNSASGTPGTSRPESLQMPPRTYSSGDFRGSVTSLIEMRSDVTCQWAYSKLSTRQWLSGFPDEGVMIKKGRGDYSCFPPSLIEQRQGFYDNAVLMNVRCAMAVSIRVITVYAAAYQGMADYIPLPDGLRLQIIPTIADLPRCQKYHFAAYVQDTGIMVVWDDDPKSMIDRADELQTSFMKFIWRAGKEDDEEDEPEKNKEAAMVTDAEVDSDVEAQKQEERKFKLLSPFIVGCTLALMLSCLGFGGRNLALEVRVDGSYLRLLILLAMPLQMFAGLFFFQTVIVNVFMLLGPISNITANSKNYSGTPPKRLDREQQQLPHVTIQMPVYKEGLNGVIRPTIRSLQQAIRTYELQGGTANIFINDDGIQVISPEQAEARREFYRENHIGWVARPKHNTDPEKGLVFVRQGKFKKASNMNYSLMISNQIEEKLQAVQRHQGWSIVEEALAYEQALTQVLEEQEGRAWADGNVRIGDYILIIDSDTRVPKDCLLDAVSEMESSPEVAILQFTSGVMQVTTSFFENGITFFTNLVYSAITYAVANGDAVPFVGHNAMLRWSAIQDAASYTDKDGYEKFWSDSHVSEDFDMALRLQCAGYQLRFAAYTGPGFKEGVSLTVNDELARWEKYAFGVSELIFHPLKYWLFRGPITPLFRKFIASNIHFPKKMTILAYIGTYYALGSTWVLVLMNYFLTGWYLGHFDKYYLDSFSIWVAIIAVFTILGNLALGIMRYRLGEKSLLGALWETFRWIPLLAIFLGGVSMHISQALLSHLFGIDMNWGATAKEYVEVDFVTELPKLVRSYKGTFSYCIAVTAAMVCLAFVVPYQWQIRDFVAVFPLAFTLCMHFLLPVALHPALMKFTW